MSDYQKLVNELPEEDKVDIYCAYLDAFSVVRSGGVLSGWSRRHGSTEQLTAQAIGASDAANEELAQPRWLLLENLSYLLYSVEKEAAPCKVVPMGGEEPTA